MASTVTTVATAAKDLKKEVTLKAIETLKVLNPTMVFDVRKLNHFHYGWGVAITKDSFFVTTMLHGLGLKLPKEWQIKRQSTGTYNITDENGETIFVRVSDKPSQE